MVEPHVANVTVEGSNPFARSIYFCIIEYCSRSYFGGVAQLAEQLTLNQRV